MPPQPVSTLTPAVLDEVFVLAVKQSVEGIVIKPLNDLYTQLGAEREVLVEHAQHKWKIVQTNKHVDQVLARIAGILRQKGIGYVLVKGQGVARHYPIAALRKPGDIDLYVGREAYQAAIEAIQPYSDKPLSEQDMHTSMYVEGIDIEIHHSVISHRRTRDGRRLLHWAEEALHPLRSRTETIAATEVNVPSAQAEAMYIFYHAWHHLFHHSGVGLRQMCDLMLTLHADHSQIDAAALERLLRSTRLLHDWRVVAAMLVGFLGMPASEIPLNKEGYQQKAEKLMHIIIEAGNHGKHTYKAMLKHRPEGRITGPLYSMRSFLGRYRRLHAVMPGSARRAMFTYMRDSIARKGQKE